MRLRSEIEPAEEVGDLSFAEPLNAGSLHRQPVERGEAVHVAAEVQEELGLDAGAVGSEPFEIEHLVRQRSDRSLQRLGEGMHPGGQAMEVCAAKCVGIEQAEEA